MSDVLAPSVFTISNGSAESNITFDSGTTKFATNPGKTESSDPFPADASPPFNITFGNCPLLYLNLEETEDTTSIAVVNLNGWTKSTNEDNFEYTYDGYNYHLKITLSDSNPAPIEIGILIVGTTECDPDETGK